MIKQLLIATHNPAKAEDYKKFLAGRDIEVLTLADVGITEKFEETGATFEESAQQKARFYYNLSKLPTLSEDGGLEIDYLNGEPGVRSRRWPGHEATDQELIDYLSNRLIDIPKDKRSARFTAVSCLVKSKSEVHLVKNSIEGELSENIRGDFRPGYPYRAFFIVKEFGKYFMDLTEEEYLRINHRRKNIEELIKLL